jgi:hypothetical protein
LVKGHKEQEAVEQDKEKRLMGLQAVAKETRTITARMGEFALHKKEAVEQSRIRSLKKINRLTNFLSYLKRLQSVNYSHS